MPALRNKVALVTGASKGIGASIAKHLASAGATIIVNYASSKTDAERVVTAITDAGGTATAIQGDFSEPEEIAATFAEIKRRFGKLDILVNNAGIYNHLPIDQITAEDFHRHYNLNVLGPLLAIKEAIALAAVPPFPPKLQGAMERAGTVTEEQFRVMLADCGNDEVWLKAMLLMSYTWGYRLEELLKMRCIQVSLTDRIVYLPPRSTKNKRPRPIPISDDEIGPLRICVSGKMPEDKVFTRKNGKPVKDFRDRRDKLVATSNAGHMEINERGERAWIPAIFHDLRRSASTNLLAGGMSPENVRKVVGHLSEEMTARYNQPAMTTLAAQQRKGAALLAAMQSAALPENVIHSSCTVDPQNGERRASSNLLYNRDLICLARVAEWQTLRT